MTQSASRPGRAAALVVVLSLALATAACGGSAASPGPSGAPTSAPTDATSPESPTIAPEPTEVPGGASVTPDPLPDDTTTTETAWGTILDAVPATFPVIPGAEPVESPDEPVSGAWISGTSIDEAAAWYRDELEAMGLSTMGLSDPLEDGSRVLDTVADIPECRIQTTFRPAGESTMITVLYAAGCAGGDG